MNVVFLTLAAAALPYQSGETDRKVENAKKILEDGVVSRITEEYQDHFRGNSTLHNHLRDIRVKSMQEQFVAEQLESRAKRAFADARSIAELTKIVHRYDGTATAEKAKYRLGVIYLDRGLRGTGLRLLGNNRDPAKVPKDIEPLLKIGPPGVEHQIENYVDLRPDWDGLFPEVSQNDFKALETGFLYSSRLGVHFVSEEETVVVQPPSKPLPTFGFDFVAGEPTVNSDSQMVDDAPAQFITVDYHTIIYSSVDQSLYGLDERGQQVWLSPKRHKGKPALFGKMLVAITEDSYCLSLDIINPETGNVEWSQPFAFMESSTEIFPLEPVIDDAGIAYCPTGEGAIMAIDLALRQLKWQTTYEITNKFEPSLPRLTFNRMVVNDRLWCLPYDSEMLLCFGLDGTLLYSVPRQDVFELGECDSGVLTIGGLGCTRINNEYEEVWTTHLDRVVGTSVGDHEKLLVPCQRYVAVLDKATGKNLGSYRVDEDFSLRNVGGQMVYCGLHAIFPATSGQLSEPVDYHPLYRGVEPVTYFPTKKENESQNLVVDKVDVEVHKRESPLVAYGTFVLPQGSKYSVTQRGTTTENRLVFTEQATGEVFQEYNIQGRLRFPDWTPVEPMDVLPVITSSEVLGLNPLESNQPIWRFAFEGDGNLPTFGPLGETFCVFRTQNKLYNLDPHTGALLWSRDVTPDQLLMRRLSPFGDARYLVFPRTYTLYSIYDMRTGEEIEAGRFPDTVHTTWGSRVIMKSKEQVRVWSPLEGVVWAKQGKYDVKMSGHWLVVADDANCHLVDLRDMTNCVVPMEGDVGACMEHNGITFVTSRREYDYFGNQTSMYSAMIQASSFDTITAIQHGEVIWTKKVGAVSSAGGFQGVLFNFYQRKSEDRGRQVFMQLLRCSDGKTLYDKEIPSDNYVALHGSGENVVLVGVNTTLTVNSESN